jgi:hypothetical protein
MASQTELDASTLARGPVTHVDIAGTYDSSTIPSEDRAKLMDVIDTIGYVGEEAVWKVANAHTGVRPISHCARRFYKTLVQMLPGVSQELRDAYAVSISVRVVRHTKSGMYLIGLMKPGEKSGEYSLLIVGSRHY